MQFLLAARQARRNTPDRRAPAIAPAPGAALGAALGWPAAWML